MPYSAPSRRPHLPWRPWRHYRSAELPPRLRPWLLDPGSLTRHLTQAAGGAFRVQRLRQAWGLPQLSEQRSLGLRSGEWALIREVILWGGDQPWVFARSVLPVRSLRGDLYRLRRLQERSLGTLLFSQPQLRRTPFELARVDGLWLPAPLAAPGTLWGRRSRFELGGRRLIVGEIFLPGFQPEGPPGRPGTTSQ